MYLFTNLPSPTAAQEDFPSNQEPEDTFGALMESTLDLFRRLEDLQEGEDVLGKLRAMDGIVENVLKEVRVKYELQLADVLGL